MVFQVEAMRGADNVGMENEIADNTDDEEAENVREPNRPEAAEAAGEARAAPAEPQRIIRMLRADGTIYEQVDDIILGPDWGWGNIQHEPEENDEDELAPLIHNA